MVVVQAVLRVEAHLGLVGIRAAGHHQVSIQVLGVVVEASLPLGRGATAAAQVDLAPRERAGTAVAGGGLQQHDLGSRAGGLDGGRGARGTKADDDHIGFLVPGGDFIQTARPVHGERY
ncbi:hypothetical protein D3C78_1494460 [compost metagenome]